MVATSKGRETRSTQFGPEFQAVQKERARKATK